MRSLALIALALTAGCFLNDHFHGAPADMAATGAGGTDDGGDTANGGDLAMPPDLGGMVHADAHKVDLLFMVDNSSSMDPMQTLLRSQFATLMKPLTDLGAAGTYLDLHIGVVTSDYGAGDTAGGGCDASPGGQKGVLQTVPSVNATNPPTGCMPPVGAPYISYAFTANGPQTNLPNGTDTTALANEFTCMAAVGSRGCGFEHQLESVYAALRDTTNNAGFLRDDALLAVVFLTNEDDGSAPPTAKFYEQANDPMGTSTYGQYTTYRQTRFAVECSGMPIPYGSPDGPLSGCAAFPNLSMNVGNAYDLSRYIDFFSQPKAQGGVKPDPNDVVLIAIDGPEAPFQTVLVNPAGGQAPYQLCAQGSTLSSTCIQALQHSCENNVQSAFFADPGVRLNAVVRSAATSSIQSICGATNSAAPDYSMALSTLANLIKARI